MQIMTAVLEKGQRPDIPPELAEAPMGNAMVAAPFVALIQSCWSQVQHLPAALAASICL